MHRLPDLQARMVGTVGVTSVGMHAHGGGLGLLFLVHTHEQVVPRLMLAVAVVADHDVVDGAPMAPFLAEFRQCLESGRALAAVDRDGPMAR